MGTHAKSRKFVLQLVGIVETAISRRQDAVAGQVGDTKIQEAVSLTHTDWLSSLPTNHTAPLGELSVQLVSLAVNSSGDTSTRTSTSFVLQGVCACRVVVLLIAPNKIHKNNNGLRWHDGGVKYGLVIQQ